MPNCPDETRRSMIDDIDRIMHIMGLAFDPVWGEAWNRRQITDSLAMPHTHYQIFDGNCAPPAPANQGAGFTLIKAAPGEEELLLIGVDPAHRGKGVGRALLEDFLESARSRGAERVFLEMRANNSAENLYRKVGFEPIGRRVDYYKGLGGQRIDAITFAMDVI